MAVMSQVNTSRSPNDTVPARENAYPAFLTASLRYGLDTTVSPCRDFDRYVNGGWRDSTVLRPGLDPFDVFRATSNQTNVILRRLLDSVRAITAVSPDADARVVGIYYASCLLADSLDRAVLASSMARADKTDTSRSARCQRIVMKDLQDALGQIFVRSIMNKQTDAGTKSLIQNIRASVSARVQALPWLSQDAKDRASAMLGKMTFRVGKPDVAIDHSELKLDANDFAGNQRTIQSFIWKHGVISVGRDNRPVWSNNQYNPNASYSVIENSIEVPTFMFQWPFFDPNSEAALGYAGAGMVIGHEMYHGVTQYISGSDQDEYKQRTLRLAKQYSALPPVEGNPIDGNVTLSENLADLGGILASYDAWQRNYRKQAVASIEGFSPEQRFFLYYARVWRAKGSARYYGQLTRDPHAYPPARINGVVMNVPAFAKAFGCRDGDAMEKSAEERADIW